jgi:hypothetical protein
MNSEKWFFWPLKLCCPPWAEAIFFFSSTLNVMISQMVRNENVRFGRHLDIQVRFKILQLEIAKEILIFDKPHGFQQGLISSNSTKKQPQSFRG